MNHKILCQQPAYQVSCAGCCGINVYGTKEGLVEAIRRNTSEFKSFNHGNPTSEDKSHHFNRRSEIDRDSGLCSLLIFLDEKETQVGCSAHPGLHGIDYRGKFNLCNSTYLCQQAKKFGSLTRLEQKKALKGLSQQYNGDWVLLSTDMEGGKIKFDNVVRGILI